MTDEIIERIKYLTQRDTKTLVQRGLKTSEEVGELSAAILSSTGADSCAYKDKTSLDVLLEAADVVMCGVSVAIEAGFSKEDLCNAMNTGLDKWTKILDEKDKV